MRLKHALTVISLAAVLSACATQEKAAPAPAATPAPAAAAPAAKAPQCWSGEQSKFVDLGVKSKEAGVDVECKPTADGKNAQWMGAKH